tara:strand:- start:91 stop:456 length:366 start_codon:yes stop_codon:yes gene_type:complete
MLNFLLPLLKNPLAKLVVDKSINAINHSLEKKKIIRAKEIEAEQNISIEQIRSAKGSIKDEVLTIKITLIFIALFIPYTQPWMEKGFEILKNAPQEFWWAVLIVYSGSFGLSTVNKIKGKK